MNWDLFIYGLPPAFAVFIALGLAVYVNIKYPKFAITQVLYSLIIFIAIINITDFHLRLSTSYENAIVWSKIFSSSWPYIISLCLHFSWVFAKGKVIHPFTYILVYLPAIIFSYIEITTNSITIKPVLQSWGFSVLPANTSLYIITMLWVLVMLGTAIYLPLREYFRSDGLF